MDSNRYIYGLMVTFAELKNMLLREKKVLKKTRQTAKWLS